MITSCSPRGQRAAAAAAAAAAAEASPESARGDESVLVLAPTGADAALAGSALAGAGLFARACRTVEEVCAAVAGDECVGALLLAREALTPPALHRLTRCLESQPPWSDVPILVLTGAGAADDPARSLGALTGATFLERPLRTATLVRAVRAALSARRRQYEIREYLRERERAAAERVALLESQRAFLRDVLSSVTSGRLRLCDDASDLPARLTPVAGDPTPIELRAETLRALRLRATEAAESLGFGPDRVMDLTTAVSEAAMNAVRHAGGGAATVGADPGAGVVQVWIEDEGRGIDVRSLPRATLERGYSSAGTLGHGFFFMLNTVDRLYLLTGPSGTTVVAEMQRAAPAPAWFG